MPEEQLDSIKWIVWTNPNSFTKKKVWAEVFEAAVKKSTIAVDLLFVHLEINPIPYGIFSFSQL